MAEQFCNYYLKKEEQLVQHHGTLLITFTTLDMVFSPVATGGNILAISALWKAASIPANIKKLFLSIAFPDLVVGSFAQLMRGVIVVVMLRIAENGKFNLEILCPSSLTLCFFSLFLLV